MPTANALIVDTIIDETNSGIAIFEGEHRASEIATATAEAVGLTLQWATDDYTLWDGFDASGDSAEQVIRDLIKPMSLERHTGASVMEPFATDFYMAGEVAVVKKRQGLTPTAEYTLSVADIGAASVRITKTRLPIWGQVTLVGRASSSAIQPRGSNDPGDPPTPNAPPLEPLVGTNVELSSFSETRNIKDGSVTQKVITRRILMPDNLPTEIRTDTFVSQKNGAGMILSSTKLETFDYYHFGYDNKGPKAHAKPLQKYSDTTSRVNESGSANLANLPLRVTAQEWTAYGYDARHIQRTEGTFKFKIGKAPSASSSNPVNVGQNITMTWHVTQNEDVGIGFTHVTKDEYTFVNLKGQAAVTDPTVGYWEHTATSDSMQGGKAPGGPQPGTRTKVKALPANSIPVPGGFQVIPTNEELTGGFTLTDNRSGQGVERVTLQATISTGAEAQIYSYSNPNLEMADLQRIMSQMRASSGLYQYQVEVKGPDAAFLRRGQYVQILGAQTPDGNQIPLDPMIITSFERKFNEAKAESSMTMVGRFWRTTDTIIATGAGGNP